jgi:hypothetical protein
MNRTSQLDLHPEAESLNAFVEQALPEPERAQVLAHLAACGRCRQVVYLAQQTSEPVPVVVVHSAAQPASWFRNWWFTWVPAAALVAMVALAVFVHVRRAETGSELARITPQMGQSAPVPPAPEQASARTAAPPPAPVAAKRSPRVMPSPPLMASEMPAETAPAAASPALPGAFESARAESLPPVAENASRLEFRTQQDTAAMRSQAAAAALRQQQMARALSPALSPGVTSSASRRAAMDVGAVPSAQGGGYTTGADAAPRIALQSAPSASFEEGAPGSSTKLDAVRMAGPIKLPSGLDAVSMATARHAILALDHAGSLFRSEDQGAHWEPVARQWMGRAVSVRATPSATFEIVNESGLIWVSSDGRICTPKE